MKPAIQNVLLIFCTGMLLLQASSRYSPSTGQYGPQIGEIMTFMVSSSDLNDQQPVNAIYSGTCRYVVIADVTCPACNNAVETWIRDLTMPDHSTAEYQDWRLFWVVLGGEEDCSALIPPGSPITAHSSIDTASIVTSLGVQAVPSVAILDRSGALVTTSQGARLPAGKLFNSDCTIGEAL